MASDVLDKPRRSWVQVVVFGRNPTRTLIRIIVLVLTVVVVSKFVLLPIRIEGVSMAPTYKTGRINFINTLAYKFREPQRGDVVAIRFSPGGTPSVMLMKRIVGMPGETVAFEKGQLLINGRALEEPYLKYPCNWTHGPEVLGTNEYYVVGDNCSMGFYDHTQGAAERRRMVGKVLL